MKKYLFFVLLLACPSLLCADTVYFKDGTCVEGKVASENDKSVVIKESKAGVDKDCEYPRSKIAKIEKKASKPTCNFSPRTSEKKVKDKTGKPAQTTASSPAKAQAKQDKSPQQVKPKEAKETKETKKTEAAKKTEEKKKTEPAKAAKPAKETPAKPKAPEAKAKTEQAPLAKKTKAQDEAFKKLESKTAKKTSSATCPKADTKAVEKVAQKKPAGPISVKPLKSAQEAELRKIEKVKSAKDAQAAKEAKAKIEQAQDKAFKKLEKKAVAAAPKPAPVQEQPEAAKEIVPEKKKIIKYRVAKREDRNLPEPSKMNRLEVSIIVSPNATNEEIESALADFLEKELSAKKKIDALWVIAYVEGEYPTRLPKLYGIWSPPGGWYDWKNISDKSQYKWDYRYVKKETLAPRW